MSRLALVRLLLVGIILCCVLGIAATFVFGDSTPPAPRAPAVAGLDAGPCLYATYRRDGSVDLHPASRACINDHRDAPLLEQIHATERPTYVMLPDAYACNWHDTDHCPAPRRDEKCVFVGKTSHVLCVWWRTKNLGRPGSYVPQNPLEIDD